MAMPDDIDALSDVEVRARFYRKLQEKELREMRRSLKERDTDGR